METKQKIERYCYLCGNKLYEHQNKLTFSFCCENPRCKKYLSKTLRWVLYRTYAKMFNEEVAKKKTLNDKSPYNSLNQKKWDGSTDSGSEYHHLRRDSGLSHEDAVKRIEGRD